MESLLLIMPAWLITVIIVATTATIIYVIIRGIQLKFKGLSVDTTQPNGTEQKVDVAHIVQFRRLKTDIETDVERTYNDFLVLFSTLLSTMVVETGIDYSEANKHEDVVYYKNILKFVLKDIYMPYITKTIFGNHFPERGNKRGKMSNELDRDYEKRFLEEYSKPTVTSILQTTGYNINQLWESTLIKRVDFQARIASESHMKQVISTLHNLLLNSMGKRNYIFEQIKRQDGTSIEQLKHEWEQIYG